jgi:hypothetical protein
MLLTGVHASASVRAKNPGRNDDAVAGRHLRSSLVLTQANSLA